MTQADRTHWDEQWADTGLAPVGQHGSPPLFAAHEHLFPTEGRALEIACGRGRGAMWLAARGLDVWAVDVSAVAVNLAAELAKLSGLGHRCRFDVVDLDEGLPEGPPVDVLLCHLFRDRRLDRQIIDRLAPEGLLAIATLSEVDVGPGPFRVEPGELRAAFSKLDIIVEGEGGGEAWLIARK